MKLCVFARSLLVILSCSFTVWSQEAQPAPQPSATPSAQATGRPTIGLVLEGGGALGLAHVGVLRWFEENHIPVDYIAGTSMGGLVGGLYATGSSATEIDKFLQGVNWNRSLRNEVPYRARSFRRKEDKRDYPNDLEFGLRRWVVFPSGFNSGQQVGLILDQVALPYSDLKTFDELPTPFRCVATDLVTGQAKVFDGGPLSEALRSTMSLPAIFSPVRRDGRVYVDGGLIENLPVDVARAMGANIVIAVHLETAPLMPDEPLSAFTVLQRSVNVVISVNELESMKKADILIPVHTEQYNSTDYQEAQKINELGYAGAKERARLLERLALNDHDWAEYVEQRKARRRPVPVPQFIEVTGTAPIIAEGIERNLAGNLGKPVDFERINSDLTDVTGLGRFARAGFQLAHRNGEEGLLVRAEEKDYAPPTVNPLFVIDGSDYTDVRFSLGARVTFNDIGGFGSELRNDFIVGNTYGAASEYYHPVNWFSHFFAAPRLFASSQPYDLYSDDARIATFREHTAGGGLDFGVAASRFSELRFGYQLDHLSLTKTIGSPGLLNNVSGRQGFSRVRYIIDHTDDPTLPRQGFLVQSRLEFYDANPSSTEHFPLAEVRTGIFHRVHRTNSLFLLASGGSTMGYRNTGLPMFGLGGPQRLAAYGTNELLANQYFLFQPGYIRRLAQLSPLLGNNVYLVADYEIGKAYGAVNQTDTRLPNDFNAAVLVESFIGPVVFGGSVGDRGHHKLYFQLGRLF
ncbi:MAG TPA: patatin-like phospholipase family protein [Terriglobales bacterium]|nr:patatin-like phospholipase family protein [Terriglobales bacterium]